MALVSDDDSKKESKKGSNVERDEDGAILEEKQMEKQDKKVSANI